MATVTLQRIRPFQEIQNGVLFGPVTNNLYTVNGLGQVTIDALDQANLLTQGWLPAFGGGGGGGGGGGELPAGGTTSQVVARSNSGAVIWHRPDGSVNVEDFYPPGPRPHFPGGPTTIQPHIGTSQTLGGTPFVSYPIFSTLAEAQAVYPFVDDLTPEMDWCAIQAAIDYAFRNSLSDIFLPAGIYVIGESIFIDGANSLRAQGSTLPGDFPSISPCGPRWTPGATFSQNQVVLYNGVPYISRLNGNKGNAPHYVATEAGSDPWWIPYYATAATSGVAPNNAALSVYSNWKVTFRGETGQPSSQVNFGTVIKPSFLNMIAAVVGPNGFSKVRDLQIWYQMPFTLGGCNPWSLGVAVPGTGGGASGTEIENVSVTNAYSAIRYFSAGSGLGDNNTVRRCAGPGCYRFLSYPATQAYINNIYDCTPQSTVGISQAPGSVLAVGGNWSAQQEGSPACTLSISNVSTISTGAGGYFKLGDVFITGASGQFLDVDVTSVLTSGNEFQLNTNAFVDGRTGVYSWFVINTPSFGPVPFTADPAAASVMNVLGALTPGSGYVPGTYHSVPLTGATSGRTDRLVDVVVGAGGAVTNVTVVYPGIGYVPGENTTTPNSNLGGSGSGFSIKATQRVHLMILGAWLDAFATPTFIADTQLQAELQAATTLYAACPVFPIQTAGTFHDLFFENANTSMCLASVGGGFGAPTIFYGGFFDADPAFATWGPFENGAVDTFRVAHWYAQRTLPFVWLTGDIIFDGMAWGNPGQAKREPIIVYTGSASPSGYKFYNRNSSTQAGGNFAPPVTFWYSAFGSEPGYSTLPRMGAGIEKLWQADQNTAIPSWTGDSNSFAKLWALYGGKSPTSGIRPSSWTIPSILPMDLTTISDPQNLPPIMSTALDGHLSDPQYVLTYGNAAYKTDVASPAQLAIIGPSSKPGTTLFESSHDFFSYHQHLTAHDGGGPGIVLGMNWTARGHSWVVHMDDNTLSLMMTGLVIGLETDVPGTPTYYIVSGIQPGLGLITVHRLNVFGYSPGISGGKTVLYTGTKIWMQPYRVRYVSSRPRFNSFVTSAVASAITAVAGEEIMADTSGGAWPLSLPLNPMQGDKVTFYDAGGAFASNKLVIDGNGSKINGSADNVTVTAGGVALYKDTTTGWIVTGGTLTGAPALLVTPVGNTAFGGMIGSPIHPASFAYTLNASSGSVAYSISGVPAWLVPSSTSGTISGSTPITFTPAFGALSPGTNTATMTFTNTATGQSTKRTVSFVVLAKQYAAEGDSITVQPATSGAVGYPGEYGAVVGTSLAVTNSASAGALANLFVRERQLDQRIGMKRTGDRYVLTVLIGTYDLLVGYTGGTQASFLAQYAAYLDRRRASGWYVIACTIPSASNPGNGAVSGGANDANIAPLNTEIRKWAGTTGIGGVAHADAVCDFAASPFFDAGSYSDATYYQADLVNPTVAGEHQLYLIIKPFIDAGLGLIASTFGTAAGTSTANAIPVVPAFNPTTLFASGETGGWWDPSDHATTWQDVAGTTPANADGQTVQRIDDKSGNGRNLTTAGGGGPVLRISGGKSWLVFDPAAPTPPIFKAFTQAQPVTRIFAAQQVTNTGSQLWMWDGYSGIFMGLLQQATSPHVAMYAGAAGDPIDATHMTIGANHVSVEFFNGASSTLQIDNNPVNNPASGGPGTTAGGLIVGSQTGGGAPASILWYGGIQIGRALTTVETNNCRTFFGAKAGLTL